MEKEKIPYCSIWACYKACGKCEERHLQTWQPFIEIRVIEMTNTLSWKNDAIFLIPAYYKFTYNAESEVEWTNSLKEITSQID